MKATLLTRFSVLALLLLALSCNQKGGLTPSDYHLSNARQVADNLGAQFFTGSMSSATGKDGTLAIIVTTADEKNSSRLSRRAIVLQREAKQDDIQQIKEGKAEFVSIPGALLVNSLEDGSRFLITVNSEEAKTFAAKIPDSYKTYTTLTGYGLSYRFGAISESPVKYVNSLGSARNVPEGGAGSCTSGGAGSISCSLTAGENSCSVSCGTGYYACCSGSGCKCVKNS